MEIRDLKGRTLGKIAMVLIALLIVLAVPALFSSVNQLSIVQGLALGITYDDSVINSSDGSQRLMGVLTLAIYIPFFVVFLLWFRKAYLNLELFGVSTNFGSGWAIGSFLVPIIAFYRPFQICKEILKGSDRNQDNSPPLLLISLWWLFFWVSNVTGNILLRTIPKEGSDIQSYVLFSQLTVLSDVIDIALYTTYLLVLIRITTLQINKARESPMV